MKNETYLRLLYSSSIRMICLTSKFPVWFLRYRAIKGMVHLSSSKFLTTLMTSTSTSIDWAITSSNRHRISSSPMLCGCKFYNDQRLSTLVFDRKSMTENVVPWCSSSGCISCLSLCLPLDASWQLLLCSKFDALA